jgi:hypothetical protein
MADLDFELEIRAIEGSEYEVEVVRSPAGVATASMRFPFDELALKVRLQALEIALLRSGGNRRRMSSPEEQTVLEFGRDLFEALISGEVRSRFDMSRGEALRQGKALRIKLRFESPVLAALPWEFLYDVRKGEYVVLSTYTPLVRYVEQSELIEPLGVSPPLHLLGVIASPSDLPHLDVEREQMRIAEATRSLQDQGLLQIDWLVNPTWRDVQQALRRDRWHIFHFVGHGGFDWNTDEGLVAFVDESGATYRLPAIELARLLGDHRTMRLAVLNACEGARASAVDLFSSTASALVRRGTPAVVAMQYEITDRAAIEFSRSFYEAIADGMAVDVAVAEARKSMSMAVTNSLEWGTPVLFMRTPDGVLFRIRRRPTREGPAFVPPPVEPAPVEPAPVVPVPVEPAPVVPMPVEVSEHVADAKTAVSPVESPPVESPPAEVAEPAEAATKVVPHEPRDEEREPASMPPERSLAAPPPSAPQDLPDLDTVAGPVVMDEPKIDDAPLAAKRPPRVRRRYAVLAAAVVGALAVVFLAFNVRDQPQAPPAATTSPFGTVDCARDPRTDSKLGTSSQSGGVTLGPEGDRTFDFDQCRLNGDDENAWDVSYTARQLEFHGQSAALVVDANAMSAQYCQALLVANATKLETTIFVKESPKPGLCVRTSDGGLAAMIVQSVEDNQIAFDFATWTGIFDGGSGTAGPTAATAGPTASADCTVDPGLQLPGQNPKPDIVGTVDAPMVAAFVDLTACPGQYDSAHADLDVQEGELLATSGAGFVPVDQTKQGIADYDFCTKMLKDASAASQLLDKSTVGSLPALFCFQTKLKQPAIVVIQPGPTPDVVRVRFVTWSDFGLSP